VVGDGSEYTFEEALGIPRGGGLVWLELVQICVGRDSRTDARSCFASSHS